MACHSTLSLSDLTAGLLEPQWTDVGYLARDLMVVSELHQ